MFLDYVNRLLLKKRHDKLKEMNQIVDIFNDF